MWNCMQSNIDANHCCWLHAVAACSTWWTVRMVPSTLVSPRMGPK